MFSFFPYMHPEHFFRAFEDRPDMADDATAEPATKTGELFKLATRPKPEPHPWPSITSATRVRNARGIEQIERACPACGLVRITVCEGEGRREYRWGNAPDQFEGNEPACVVGVK